MTRSQKAKRCSGCRRTLPPSDFARNRTRKDGLQSVCRACDSALGKLSKAAYGQKNDADFIREAEARARRLESDYEALRAEDFDVSVGNDGRHDPKAAREKRQEYSLSMGRHARAVRTASLESSQGNGDVLDNLPPDSGTYIGKLAEQERRFANRRLARSVSLADAHEALAIRHFKEAAAEYLSDKVTPTGYARKPANTTIKRTTVLLLSDLHLGSDLSSLDEPLPFRAIEEARRLEFIVRQALDYKPQYRKHSELLLIINGDIIEGQLGHQLRDGAPLTEQKVIFWRYFRQIVGLCAQQYPKVRVVCQPGNHGRDKMRHPGRATSRKWDGHEWECYYALQQMCSGLLNVEWQLDFRAVSIVDLYGSVLGVTHGDTELPLGNPDTASTKNGQTFDRTNSARVFGVEFDAWAVGHFHMPRYQPRNPRVVWNGALVPPNGHARASGYVGEPCGQFLWEAVEGYPVGDVRFIEVDSGTDNDERLGKLVTPFRFE